MDLNKIIIKILYLFQGLFFKKDKNCPFCSNSDYKIVFKKFGLIDINHCNQCFLYWTNPIFKFPKFYDILYKAEGLVNIPNLESLNKLISSNFIGSDKDYFLILGWLKSVAPGKKLLEFGSSWGYFLYQAKNYGFQVTGVEVSNKKADFAKKYLGVNIETSLDNLMEQKLKFDIIFTAHTLEHIGYEIKDIFKNFNKLLIEGGILIIEVPFLDIKKRGDKIFGLMGAVHPLGFTDEFFLKNLPVNGFDLKIYHSYGEIINQMANSDQVLIVVAEKRFDL